MTAGSFPKIVTQSSCWLDWISQVLFSASLWNINGNSIKLKFCRQTFCFQSPHSMFYISLLIRWKTFLQKLIRYSEEARERGVHVGKLLPQQLQETQNSFPTFAINDLKTYSIFIFPHHHISIIHMNIVFCWLHWCEGEMCGMISS